MRRKDREIVDVGAIDAILREADACRLALIGGGVPYAVTLNYGFERSADGALVLYFHCAREGRKLDAIRSDPRAAFIVDTAHELVRGEKGCDWGMRYRSVAGNGVVSFVSDDAEKRRGLDLLMEHYSGSRGFEYDDRVFAVTEVLRLDVEACSGKEKA